MRQVNKYKKYLDNFYDSSIVTIIILFFKVITVIVILDSDLTKDIDSFTRYSLAVGGYLWILKDVVYFILNVHLRIKELNIEKKKS